MKKESLGYIGKMKFNNGEFDWHEKINRKRHLYVRFYCMIRALDEYLWYACKSKTDEVVLLEAIEQQRPLHLQTKFAAWSLSSATTEEMREQLYIEREKKRTDP